MFPAEESTDVYISTSSPALSSISSILPLSSSSPTSSSSLSSSLLLTPLKTAIPTTKTISTIFNINSNPISISIPNQSISSSSSLSILSSSSIKSNQKKEIKSAQAIGTKDIIIDIPTLSSTLSQSQSQSSSSLSIKNNRNTTILQTSLPSSSYLTEESLIEKSLSLPSIISTLSSSKIIPTITTTTTQPTTVTTNKIKIDRISNNEEKQSYHYKCIPPPLFVILVSVIEIAVFLYESWFVKINEFYNDDDNIPVPSDSILVYRPDRRQEIWRFFSYMVLHANWFHLSFNVLTQLIFGIPLELVHGSVRIGCIYLAGVFAGSLGTSVVDTKVYLCGASGGVYALLGAHLANILLNYKKINYIKCKLFLIILFSLCDIGFALYTRYFQNHDIIINISINTVNHGIIHSNFVSHNMNNTMPPISYIAHLSGVLAGLTIGLLVLKNFVLIENPQNLKIKSQNNLLWWTALGIYMAFLIFTITFNIMNTMTAQILEEKSQIIKQYLFHNLGGSS